LKKKDKQKLEIAEMENYAIIANEFSIFRYILAVHIECKLLLENGVMKIMSGDFAMRTEEIL